MVKAMSYLVLLVTVKHVVKMAMCIQSSLTLDDTTAQPVMVKSSYCKLTYSNITINYVNLQFNV